MSDSFLSQLEQRTQQVKITLANLEAERTRIDALIGQLQPLVPHYDALLDAERALVNANIELERVEAPAVEASAEGQASSWEQQHKPSWEQGGESSGWNS